MDTELIGGRYRLDGELGSGGMGTVWRGFDELLARPVAVKEIRFPLHTSAQEHAELTARAMTEARAAAALTHPAIVAVHDVTMHDGRPWIIMQLVPGRSLQEVVNEDGPLSPEEAAQVGLRLLDALNAAHAGGVTHRDVKPSNVLMPGGGETAMLTDFSIAKVMGYGTTATSMPMGSAGYVAPERMLTGVSGPEGDLFGLGATLFFALEGKGPFHRPDAMVAILAAAIDPHPRPQNAGYLTAVLDALLMKDPRQRATSAQARAMLLQGPVIQAAPQPPAPPPPFSAPPVEPPVSSPLSAPPVDSPLSGPPLGSPLSASPVGSPLSGPPLESPLSAPPVEFPLSPSPVPSPQAGSPLAPSPVAPPVSSPPVGSPLSPPPVSAPPVRSPVSPPASVPPAGSPASAPPVGSPGSPPLAGSPVSAPLAGSPGSPPPAGSPGSAPLVGSPGSPSPAGSPVSAPPVGSPGSPPPAGSPVSAPPVGSPGWPPPVGSPVAAPQAGAPVSAPPVGGPSIGAAGVVAPPGSTPHAPPVAGSLGSVSAVVGGSGGDAAADPPTLHGRPWNKIQSPAGFSRGRATVPKPPPAREAVKEHPHADPEPQRRKEEGGRSRRGLLVAGAGLVAAAAIGGTAWVLRDRGNGQQPPGGGGSPTPKAKSNVEVLAGHKDQVWAVAWASDSKRIASASADFTVRLWTTTSDAATRVLTGHAGEVWAVQWSPDGTHVASGAADNTTRIWDVQTGAARTLDHDQAVRAVAWSPDGRLLATGSNDRKIRIWEAASGQLVHTLVGHQTAALALAWSPDGKALASVGDLGDQAGFLLGTVIAARVWDPVTGTQKMEIVTGKKAAPGPRIRLAVAQRNISPATTSVAWSWDSTLLATGNDAFTTWLWDAKNGQQLRVLSGHTDIVNAVAFKPGEPLLATASSDQTMLLWNVGSSTVLRTFNGHTDAVNTLAFSPDGKSLVSGSSDKTLRLWSAVA
ncbi:WD40 repeat domain-containing serine/threonine protein kinase [Rhizocola hellebori]|uniref:WD40 repeat domain-containing serine/threonine protein kinase n=1 Tax=Rhizocola hellebori TaxID=1392758 RepID=UPI00194193D2|nr:serine/threonine-protein kinase [Rhizocola hellebori]